MRRAGLAHRLDVIQSSSRADCDEMFFDAALWDALVDYARAFAPDGTVSVVEASMWRRFWWLWRVGREEVSVSAYLARPASADGERGPADAVVVRRDGIVLLYIAVTCWAAVGGPYPYHDSYSYALYARSPLGRELFDYLKARTAASGWRLDAGEGL